MIRLQGLKDPLVFKASLFGGLVETPGSGVWTGRNRGSIHEFAKGADLNNGRRAVGSLDRSPFGFGLREPGLFRVVVAAKFPLVLPVTGEAAFLVGDGSEIPFVRGREPAQSVF